MGENKMRVNLNRADWKDLQEIIHIGPKRAEMILSYRMRNVFRDIHELSNVSHIGAKRMADIIKQGLAVV